MKAFATTITRGRPATGLQPPLFTVSAAVASPAVAALWERAFGPAGATARPGALEWVRALEPLTRLSTSGGQLAQCNANPLHQYHTGLSTCPWCQLEQQIPGWSPFELPKKVHRPRRKKTALPPPPLPPVSPAPVSPQPVPPPVTQTQPNNAVPHGSVIRAVFGKGIAAIWKLALAIAGICLLWQGYLSAVHDNFWGLYQKNPRLGTELSKAKNYIQLGMLLLSGLLTSQLVQRQKNHPLASAVSVAERWAWWGAGLLLVVVDVILNVIVFYDKEINYYLPVIGSESIFRVANSISHYKTK